jgi:protein-tyrosine phosphatase
MEFLLLVSNLQSRKKDVLTKFKKSKAFSILFICSGNIIRSPYAEILFEYLIQDESKLKSKIHVESGAVTYRNYSISRESFNQLVSEGIQPERISKFKPRHIKDHPKMLKNADLILVMAKGHLKRIPSDYQEKTFLFLDFIKGLSESVPDPFFDPPFERAFDLIKDALIQLRDKLIKVL